MMLPDEGATRALGAALANVLRTGDVVTLSGPLGVGKTSLARALLQALGEEDEVPSPSFALVQPYEHLRPAVWHCDLYRLDDPSELTELGLDDISSYGILIVEWPERAPGAWPHALALSLERLEDGARRLTAKVPPSWEARWPPPPFLP